MSLPEQGAEQQVENGLADRPFHVYCARAHRSRKSHRIDA